MALEAIVLAVDGVVAETHESRREAFNDVFSEAGVGWHWDRACYAQLLRTVREQELAAGAMIAAFIRERVVWRRNGGDLSKMIAAMERRHATLLKDRFLSRRVQLRPGIASFLHAAAREEIALAIVTRDDGENVRTLLSTRLPVDLSAAIDVVPVCVQGRLTDRSNAYAQAIGTLDIDSRCCLVVENSARDLAEAREAGLASVMTWGLYPRIDEAASLLNRDPSSIADASSFFLSRWDCAPPGEVLRYLRDVHAMQCRRLHPSNVFTPASVTLDKEVDDVGFRYLEA